MEFEHFALNVKEPLAVANWYVDALEMKIVSQQLEAPFMTFLADRSGRVVVELYHNQAAEVPNYAHQHPLVFHFAFKTLHAQELKENLLGKGCTLQEEIKKDDGTHLVMLRDPWGLALQLCERAVPLG